MAGRLLARLDPGRFALGAGICIAGLGVMGSLWITGPRVLGFDLKGEINFPSTFTTGLLLLVALLALALAGPVGPRRLFITFSALFAFLALDSFLAIHNRVQDVVGVRRNIPYIPVVLAGAALIVAVWRRLRSIPGVTRMLAGGTAAWSVAVGIDSLQTNGEPVWAIVPEEILEMAGSTLFVLALLLALRAATTPTAAVVSSAATVKRAVRVPATPLLRTQGAPHPTAP